MPTSVDHQVLKRLCSEASLAQDGMVRFSTAEASRWPDSVFTALTNAGLVFRGEAFESALCPGCWRQCSKSIALLPEPSILCDEEEDFGVVDIDFAEVDGWVFSRQQLAKFIEDEVQKIDRNTGKQLALQHYSGGTGETISSGLRLGDFLEVCGSKLMLRLDLVESSFADKNQKSQRVSPATKASLKSTLARIERTERDGRIVREINKRAKKLGPRKISQICQTLAKERFEGMDNADAIRRHYYRSKK